MTFCGISSHALSIAVFDYATVFGGCAATYDFIQDHTYSIALNSAEYGGASTIWMPLSLNHVQIVSVLSYEILSW
jgi:hypothetical protein